MSKKAARSTTTRSTRTDRPTPGRATTRTTAVRTHGEVDDERDDDPDAGNDPDVPDRLELQPAENPDEETTAERNERLRAHRVANAKRVQKPVGTGDLAAPGKVHQPVKESGAGTPSADARPGRSMGFGTVLEEDVVDLTKRLQRQQADSITVQATQTGYYDNIRRRPGEIFRIHADGTMVTDKETGKTRPATAEEAFSPRWMKRVADKTKLSGTKGPNQIIRERHDEILGARVSGQSVPAAGDEADDDNPLGAD